MIDGSCSLPPLKMMDLHPAKKGSHENRPHVQVKEGRKNRRPYVVDKMTMRSKQP